MNAPRIRWIGFTAPKASDPNGVAGLGFSESVPTPAGSHPFGFSESAPTPAGSHPLAGSPGRSPGYRRFFVLPHVRLQAAEAGGGIAGQAMLETILLIALVGLVAGVALRSAGFTYSNRVEALQYYYSPFVP